MAAAEEYSSVSNLDWDCTVQVDSTPVRGIEVYSQKFRVHTVDL